MKQAVVLMLFLLLGIEALHAQDLITSIQLSEDGVNVKGYGANHRSYELQMSANLKDWLPLQSYGDALLEKYQTKDDITEVSAFVPFWAAPPYAFFRFTGKNEDNSLELSSSDLPSKLPTDPPNPPPGTPPDISSSTNQYTFNLSLENGVDVIGVAIDVWFDPAQFSFVEARTGSFFSENGTKPVVTLANEVSPGHIVAGSSRLTKGVGISGSGTLIVFVFTPKNLTDGYVSFSRGSLWTNDPSSPKLKLVSGSNWTPRSP